MKTKKSNQKVVKAVEQENTEPVDKNAVEKVEVSEPTVTMPQVIEIETGMIVPNPMNPRKYFNDESLTELAQNINEHGVLQPITVREILTDGVQKFEIVFGERRYRAAKIAGLEKLPCMVRILDDDKTFDMLISENLQRIDIRPSEEAGAFKQIINKGNSIACISERFGKSESFIHSRLILTRLIPEITALLDNGEVPIGHAVEIAKLEADIQTSLYRDHLETELNYNNWKNLSFKVFKEKLESNYTMQLSRFAFDKSECAECPYNSELKSLFPVLENSRCTKSACLIMKQEKHIQDSILDALKQENVPVYSNGNRGVNSEVFTSLQELGIEVKYGNACSMPEIPQKPEEEDFMDDKAGYDKAMDEYNSKTEKFNALQGLLDNGIAQKVIMIDNLEPVYGYVMVDQAKEDNDGEGGDSNSDNPASTEENGKTKIKPDLLSTLTQKDQKNREKVLCNVISDAKSLFKDMDISPADLSPFEENLMFFVMLADLDKKHYELFGLKEQVLSDEDKLKLYSCLTPEKKNALKRDFLIKNMTQASGICKKNALLVELAKQHFPVEMAEIENSRNEEYQKQQETIRQQMDKLKTSEQAVQNVA